ncbi:MAG: AAA family ATPase [Euryarchaeota archaeon]|nr:AAA family ATPase [Euryarchaeota archaeon]
MNRILVLGSPGAGKSTFSRRLGIVLGFPVIHLDAHFWKPGWEKPERKAWIETQRELIASSESWIMDGNYGSTIEVRLREADTVILLDIPRRVCLSRVFRRRLLYRNESRPDMAEGCPEKVDVEFLRYIWSFPSEKLAPLERRLDHLDDEMSVVRLSSDDEIEAFLDSASDLS